MSESPDSEPKAAEPPQSSAVARHRPWHKRLRIRMWRLWKMWESASGRTKAILGSIAAILALALGLVRSFERLAEPDCFNDNASLATLSRCIAKHPEYLAPQTPFQQRQVGRWVNWPGELGFFTGAGYHRKTEDGADNDMSVSVAVSEKYGERPASSTAFWFYGVTCELRFTSHEDAEAYSTSWSKMRPGLPLRYSGRIAEMDTRRLTLRPCFAVPVPVDHMPPRR